MAAPEITAAEGESATVVDRDGGRGHVGTATRASSHDQVAAIDGGAACEVNAVAVRRRDSLCSCAGLDQAELVRVAAQVLITDVTVEIVGTATVERERASAGAHAVAADVVDHQTANGAAGARGDAGKGLTGAAQVKAHPVADGVVGAQHRARGKLVARAHAQVGLVASVQTQHHAGAGQGGAVGAVQDQRAVANAGGAREGVLAGERERACIPFAQLATTTDDATERLVAGAVQLKDGAAGGGDVARIVAAAQHPATTDRQMPRLDINGAGKAVSAIDVQAAAALLDKAARAADQLVDAAGVAIGVEVGRIGDAQIEVSSIGHHVQVVGREPNRAVVDIDRSATAVAVIDATRQVEDAVVANVDSIAGAAVSPDAQPEPVVVIVGSRTATGAYIDRAAVDIEHTDTIVATRVETPAKVGGSAAVADVECATSVDSDGAGARARGTEGQVTAAAHTDRARDSERASRTDIQPAQPADAGAGSHIHGAAEYIQIARVAGGAAEGLRAGAVFHQRELASRAKVSVGQRPTEGAAAVVNTKINPVVVGPITAAERSGAAKCVETHIVVDVRKGGASCNMNIREVVGPVVVGVMTHLK